MRRVKIYSVLAVVIILLVLLRILSETLFLIIVGFGASYFITPIITDWVDNDGLD